MAGRGPAPKRTRRRANAPVRGEWQETPGHGWQHGPTPPPPADLPDGSVPVWHTWLRSWFAAHWTPDDLPGLHLLIGLHARCQAGGTAADHTELRMWLDSYGITPKGQQDRRWSPPTPQADGGPADGPRSSVPRSAKGTSRHANLRAVK